MKIGRRGCYILMSRKLDDWYDYFYPPRCRRLFYHFHSAQPVPDPDSERYAPLADFELSPVLYEKYFRAVPSPKLMELELLSGYLYSRLCSCWCQCFYVVVDPSPSEFSCLFFLMPSGSEWWVGKIIGKGRWVVSFMGGPFVEQSRFVCCCWVPIPKVQPMLITDY